MEGFNMSKNSNNTDSLMQIIIKKLSRDENAKYCNKKCKNWINNENHWDEEFIDSEKFAEDIVSIVKTQTEDEQIIYSKTIEKRERNNISIVKKDNKAFVYRGEELLERLIQILNKDMLGNQIIPKLNKPGKQLIDLAEFKNNDLIKIIELKILIKSETNKVTANTPLFTVIELIKNYFLCGGEKSNINELILLAPNNYCNYDKFKLSNNEKFKRLLKNLSNILKLKISAKCININYDKWQNEVEHKIEEYRKNNQYKWNKPTKKQTERYDFKIEIDLNDFYKSNKLELNKLKIDKWEEICN